jgi:hypothetical protein
VIGGRTDGQTEHGEVIPIRRHYSVEAIQKSFLNRWVKRQFTTCWCQTYFFY